MKKPNVYECRKTGREFCQTEGSDHYKSDDNIEPLDLIIAQSMLEKFALGSIIKYAGRFSRTGNLNDLKKISDYAQILAGYYIATSPTQSGGTFNGAK